MPNGLSISRTPSPIWIGINPEDSGRERFTLRRRRILSTVELPIEAKEMAVQMSNEVLNANNLNAQAEAVKGLRNQMTDV